MEIARAKKLRRWGLSTAWQRAVFAHGLLLPPKQTLATTSSKVSTTAVVGEKWTSTLTHQMRQMQ
jgi:hypothetical protein